MRPKQGEEGRSHGRGGWYPGRSPCPFLSLPCPAGFFNILFLSQLFLHTHARMHARPAAAARECLPESQVPVWKITRLKTGISQSLSLAPKVGLVSSRLGLFCIPVVSDKPGEQKKKFFFFFFFCLRSVTSCDNFVRTSHCGGHEIHAAHLECVSTPVTRREHTRPKHRSFSP